MSETTDFAGLEALSPGEPLTERFLGDNIRTIDRMLQVGTVTHRHDGHAALADPPQEEDTGPFLEIDAVGGTIPADLGIYVGYTWVDADGGETILSDASLISTEPGLVAPTISPDLALDHAAGGLLANTYTYGVTVSDGLGGETPLGATAQITVPPGFATSQVQITGLADILTETGGTQWRLYRARGAGNFTYLTTGAGDAVTDDNTLCPQCDQTPPLVGSTANTNQLLVTLPAGPWPTGVASLRLYASIDGSFQGACLLGTYLPADAGAVQTFAALSLQEGQPPTVNLSLPGADKIDPDTEMLDFPWKRPVADAAALPAVGNENGDIRETLDDHALHTWDGAAWVDLAGGGGGGGGGTPLYAMDQPVGWVKNGVTVVSLRPAESTITEIVMDEPFDQAAGPLGDGYAADGAGNGIPAASGNNTDAIHYPGLGTMLDGKVEREFSVDSLNWTRAGVTIGHGRRGLFAWVTIAGNLVIAWRDVDTGAEIDYTVLVTEPLPDAPTGGEYWNIELERVDNHLHAFVHAGKAVIAEAEADIPLALRAEFGAGQALGGGLADRWSNPDAWSIVFARSTAYHRHRELWADVKTEGGATISRRLLRDDDSSAAVLFSAMTTGYSSADWVDDAIVGAWYQTDDDNGVRLAGRAVKISGAAMVLNDVIATLDEAAWPLVEQLVPVVTGDIDGLELGMVRIDTAGVITWLDGRSSVPNVKSPYVSFDGISYLAA